MEQHENPRKRRKTMPTRVTYVKNLVSGPKKGTNSVETVDIASPHSMKKAMILKGKLMQVTDLFPQTDPVTGALCFITNIELEKLPDEQKAEANENEHENLQNRA